MSSVFCHRILEGLWAAGVRDMIVSPGSRSTPLLLAALDSKLRLHSVIDERSAAFFALGKARAQGRAVALLCTSGSAGSHYLPALLEARYAGHCLVALTADRPPELHGSGANQTIDQRQLFASACPPCTEVAVPEEREKLALAARRRVHAAVVLADGPVHINVAFRKPLEPAPGAGKPVEKPLASVERPQLLASDERVEKLVEACESATRGLIVCGPTSAPETGRAVRELARHLGFPLVAESTSGARLVGKPQHERVDAFPHILSVPALANALAPDLILQFGSDPASGPLLRFLDGASARRIRFGTHPGLRDATGATELVLGEVANAAERVAAKASPSASTGYLDAWREADTQAWHIANTHLAQSTPALREPEAVATILEGLRAGTQLTLGNSLPIRTVDTVLPGSCKQLRVLHQRGTSGIEGLVAGALGGCGSQPSALLLGDVSFSHDLSSLALHHRAEGALAIFVIDNGGGKIFSHLPVADLELRSEHWEFWETPPAVNIELACAAHGLAYRGCTSRKALGEAIRWAQEPDAVRVVHVAVVPDSVRTFLSDIRDALA